MYAVCTPTLLVCQFPQCQRQVLGNTNYCSAHGGGKCCNYPGCSKRACKCARVATQNLRARTTRFLPSTNLRCKFSQQPPCRRTACCSRLFDVQCQIAAFSVIDPHFLLSGPRSDALLCCTWWWQAVRPQCFARVRSQRACVSFPLKSDILCVCRCKHPTCDKSAQGRTDFCISHGEPSCGVLSTDMADARVRGSIVCCGRCPHLGGTV